MRLDNDFNSLKQQIRNGTGERYYIADIRNARQIHNHALETETESAMRYAAVLS